MKPTAKDRERAAEIDCPHMLWIDPASICRGCAALALADERERAAKTARRFIEREFGAGTTAEWRAMAADQIADAILQSDA